MKTPRRRVGRRLTAALMPALLIAAGAAAATTSAALGSAALGSQGTPVTADIRDIRGPKPIGSPWLIPAIALTGMLAAGGAYASWVWNRRRFAAARRHPLDIAIDRLDRARELMLPDRGREFSIEVSSAVREYIESGFHVMAARLTTHEFLQHLLEPGNSPLAEHQALLGEFLQTSDLGKFGGWNLSAEEMQSMLASARRFVLESAATAATLQAAPPSIALAASIPSSTVPASQSSTPRRSYVAVSST